MGTASALAGHYDDRLVAISVCIAILVAYGALDLAERVSAARRASRILWFLGGAAVLGAGAWTVHAVGMAALVLPLPVEYDWPTALAALLAAILASGVALFVVSRPTMAPARAAVGSAIAGSGFASMHYLGLQSMRLKATCVHSPGLVVLSVVLSVAVTFMALQLAFSCRDSSLTWTPRKLGSGLLLGLAIPAMHYAGMAAVTFFPSPACNGSLAHAMAIGPVGTACIVAALVVALGHVHIISVIDRRLSLQAVQLAETGIQLKTIFDSLKEGIILIDKGSRLIQVNQAAARILGLPDEVSTVKSVTDVVHSYTLDGVRIPLDQLPGARALRGQFEQNRELEVRSLHTGKSTIVEIGTAPIADFAGAPIQIIITYRDVTERRRTEEASARLVAIVESSQDAIIGKDLNGIVTSWNKGAEKIFGYTAEEMIGKQIQLLLPQGCEHEEDGILERLRQGETIEQLETARQRKDGQLIQVSLMISPIRDGNGKIIGASKIARDITEKRLLERQLRQSQKMEAIGQLTGGIAHDFNNLLAIVIGNLGLLEKALAGNEEALGRLRPVQRAATRGAELTRRLLALASKEDLRPASVRLDEAIQETIELASRALGPEINLLTFFDRSVPAVHADAAGLQSALLNLAVNARDAMPKGGTLTFSTQLSDLDESYPPVRAGDVKAGTYACVSITDTGHGMSRETLDRALEPFFTTKPRDKGTGLGLPMVYGFARQSGGAVRLYSEPGFGTSVSLYLPLATEPAHPAAVAEPQPEPAAVRPGSTVLVVDDEPELLVLAQAYLTDMGYTALCAGNGASALKLIARHKEIDLMITDIVMPGGMNGVELAKKARRINPGLQVIYSSGFPADALAERSGTNVDGPTLRKPYMRSDFAAIVRQAMRQRTTGAAALLQPQARTRT